MQTERSTPELRARENSRATLAPLSHWLYTFLSKGLAMKYFVFFFSQTFCRQRFSFRVNEKKKAELHVRVLLFCWFA